MDILDYKLIYALHNKNHQFTTSDGMDIGVLVINESQSRAYFSGARSNLYYYANGEENMDEIKGDRFSLGYVDDKTKKEFTRKIIDYSKGDVFYLTSDGFPDQHNPAGKKYMRGNFKKLLSDLAPMDLTDQLNGLEKEFYRMETVRKTKRMTYW